VPFLNHRVSAALSHEIPVSRGWRVVASLIGGLCIPLVLINELLGKGRAGLVMGAWLIAFLIANYVGLMFLMD